MQGDLAEEGRLVSVDDAAADENEDGEEGGEGFLAPLAAAEYRTEADMTGTREGDENAFNHLAERDNWFGGDDGGGAGDDREAAAEGAGEGGGLVKGELGGRRGIG